MENLDCEKMFLALKEQLKSTGMLYSTIAKFYNFKIGSKTFTADNMSVGEFLDILENEMVQDKTEIYRYNIDPLFFIDSNEKIEYKEMFKSYLKDIKRGMINKYAIDCDLDNVKYSITFSKEYLSHDEIWNNYTFDIVEKLIKYKFFKIKMVISLKKYNAN